ncbi:MAG: DUF2076 domain-containing protein [Bosea sp. (in: a-proteobacteria)]
MTPQERDVINGIFERMKAAQGQQRDPEVEKFIADKIASQPYAPYAMAQSVYVQEQALLHLQSQVEELQAQVQALQPQAQQAPAQSGGSFLGGLFGGRVQPAAARSAVPATGAGSGRPMGLPPGMGQQPMNPGMNAMQAGAPGAQGQAPAGPWGGQQRQGGGFLQTAMATAAGVAGGVVLGNVLMNAFSGSKPEAAAGNTGNESAAAPADAGPASQEAYQPEAYQPASYEEPGFDGGFDGGGGDWA